MHLEINQSNAYANTEVVSNKLITKLYDLAYEDLLTESVLDSTSTFKGRLKVSATYKECIDYLTEKYPELIITADTYYYRFVDPEMEKLVVKYYGGGEDGVTIQLLYAITSFSSAFWEEISSTNILILDFTPFERLNFLLMKELNYVPHLREIRFKNYPGRISIALLHCGDQQDPSSGIKIIDKFIVDGVGAAWSGDLSTQYQGVFNGDPVTGGILQIIDTFAVRNIGVNCYSSVEDMSTLPDNRGIWFLTYFLRGKRYNNFYLGESNPERVRLLTGYGDSPSNIINFYVPVGCAEAYLNSTTWGTRWSNFIEYDFDLDPDNIFG